MVPLQGQVHAKYYLLEYNGRPVANFVVDIVPVMPVSQESSSVQIWPPKRKPAQRRRAGDEPAEALEDEVLALEDEARPQDEEDIGADGMDEAVDQSLDDAEDLLVPVDVVAAGAVEGAAGGEEVPGVGEPPARQPGVAAEEAPPVPHAPPGRATVTYHVPGGSISYYASKSAFEAVCEVREHGRCVVTRTRNARITDADGRQYGGRPVGMLAAWLARGHECTSKEDHWAQRFTAPAQERLALRERIRQTLAGELLLSCERPRQDGEEEEPPTLRGLT